MSYPNTIISIEKFIDYLIPLVSHLDTEVIQLESYRCKDNEGYGYLAMPRFVYYKDNEFGKAIDEKEIIEFMANNVKEELENKIKQAKEDSTYILNIKKLGLYQIWVQHNVPDNIKEGQNYGLFIWIRYGFGKKNMFDNMENK